MKNIDYELGFASMSGEEYNYADGEGIAKAALLACNTKCIATHPFSKTKRELCKSNCLNSYNAKISYINSLETSKTDALASATSSSSAPTYTKPVGTSLPISKKIVPTTTTPTEVKVSETASTGMGMGAKIGIGVGVLAIFGVGIYLVKRKK